MIGAKLKKYAGSLGLQVKGDVACGDYQGYTLTMYEGAGTKTLCVCARFPSQDEKDAFLYGLNEKRKEFRIMQLVQTQEGAAIVLTDAVGTMKRLDALMGWLIPALRQAGALGADTCAVCAQPLEAFQRVNARMDSIVCGMHEACAQQMQQVIGDAQQQLDSEDKRAGRGFIGALLGGLIGAIPWIIVYHFGWFAALLGAVIGIGSKKGYEIFGGRPAKAKKWIVMLCVIFSVVASFIVYFMYLGTTYGYTGENAFYFAMVLFFDSAVWVDIGLGLFFAILGCWQIFRELGTEAKGFSGRFQIID